MVISHLTSAARALAFFSVVFGMAYPLLMTASAQALFKEQANGSIVLKDGAPVGSLLIAQKFTSERYFHARPSAGDYATVASGASNASPSSPVFKEAVEKRAADLGAPVPSVPFDMLTTSGSGLDPHISRDAALFQLTRIAAARNVPEADLMRLIEAKAIPLSGIFAPAAPVIVNVLELNLALDAGVQGAGAAR
ncbi:MAG: potassium-transporting ATPase subunit KdpC [Silvanigrellales bacterium]|jgi:K+-transporting ATPase ATPase C chain|nr:potassium-transporting ATPase subunit KdpC [Silvanigrellales bacterium]